MYDTEIRRVDFGLEIYTEPYDIHLYVFGDNSVSISAYPADYPHSSSIHIDDVELDEAPTAAEITDLIDQAMEDAWITYQERRDSGDY